MPHQTQAVLETKGDKCITGGRILQQQAFLLNTHEITIKIYNTLNPVTLIPLLETTISLTHNCIDVINEIFFCRSDLRDNPLPNPDHTQFADGSSFTDLGIRKPGYAIVSLYETIQAQPLPPSTSAQKAKLIALI